MWKKPFIVAMQDKFMYEYTHLERCLPLLFPSLIEHRLPLLIENGLPGIGQTHPILQVAIHLQRRLQSPSNDNEGCLTQAPIRLRLGLAVLIRSLMLDKRRTHSHGLHGLVKGRINTCFEMPANGHGVSVSWQTIEPPETGLLRNRLVSLLSLGKVHLKGIKCFVSVRCIGDRNC